MINYWGYVYVRAELSQQALMEIADQKNFLHSARVCVFLSKHYTISFFLRRRRRSCCRAFSLWPCAFKFVCYFAFIDCFYCNNSQENLKLFRFTYGIAMFLLCSIYGNFDSFSYTDAVCGPNRKDTVKSASVVFVHTNGRLKLVHTNESVYTRKWEKCCRINKSVGIHCFSCDQR